MDENKNFNTFITYSIGVILLYYILGIVIKFLIWGVVGLVIFRFVQEYQRKK